MTGDTTSWLGRALNLVAILAVGYYFTRFVIAGEPAWVVVVGYAAFAAWIALVVVSRRWAVVTLVLGIAVAVGAALVTVSSDGTMVIPVALVTVRILADLRWAPWVGVAIGLGSAAIVAAGVFIEAFPPLGLISIEAGIVIAILGGLSRRQFRAADRQARQLAEERAEAAALADRQAVARDIHDVLAHSLGGLVIQLDAVEALLEAGRTKDAEQRVHEARALAASGLAEAKRAVGALRDPESTGAVDFSAAVDDLVRAHRGLGGSVELTESGVRHPLPADAATALSRTLQESLTNARKHAAGQPVRVALVWTADGAELVVDNPVGNGSAVAVTGGGYGLSGMAERFGELPGSRFSAGVHAGRFVVNAAVGTP